MIHSSRIGLAHSLLAVFAIAILAKAASVQLVHGREWRARAERQQSSEKTIPAPRGDILDATHRVLAQSREMVRLEIAPREVNEPQKLRRALAKLGLDAALIRRAGDTNAKYFVVPGEFLAVDAAPAMMLSGVHSYSAVERSYAVSQGGQGIVGHVTADDKGVDGVELALDSILRGVAGQATMFKDTKGQSRESPTAPGIEPTKGNTVVLTINNDLQEIAEKSLADAVAKMGAEGGDIVILDPHTGDVLAMASRRLDPRATSATVVTEPFEPGSTAKPFMAAGLIDRGRVTDHDSVDTGDGVLELPGRKNPIHDEHLIGRAPLSEVLRWSSNIGIVKFSQRLTPREEFETLRDFGFGMPTGVQFPTESAGSLRPPSTWSATSAASMAMGYEVAVTPLQLAAAYATFANGGELIEPALVKEVIGPDGSVKYRHTPRVVRRVVSRATADKVRNMLLDVVDEGTALKAAIDNYRLAGKTGTPRATVHGHYASGRYNPNFVSLFPGDNPQYVMVVKLTAPQSSIFAAETAAPVTKAILEAAIAARDAALDRGKLASSEMPSKKDTARQPAVAQAGVPASSAPRAMESAAPVPIPVNSAAYGGSRVPFVITLPMQRQPPVPRVLHVIPDVRGMTLRDAVRSLHSAGFRVQLTGVNGRGMGSGTAGTSPAAGEMAPTGTLVRLVFN